MTPDSRARRWWCWWLCQRGGDASGSGRREYLQNLRDALRPAR
uniref:Uncharacterized protein n=1 Tax=Arundo donax TaxID=35708 RepID=A0A0A8ZQU4_ARUDO